MYCMASAVASHSSAEVTMVIFCCRKIKLPLGKYCVWLQQLSDKNEEDVKQ